MWFFAWLRILSFAECFFRNLPILRFNLGGAVSLAGGDIGRGPLFPTLKTPHFFLSAARTLTVLCLVGCFVGFLSPTTKVHVVLFYLCHLDFLLPSFAHLSLASDPDPSPFFLYFLPSLVRGRGLSERRAVPIEYSVFLWCIRSHMSMVDFWRRPTAGFVVLRGLGSWGFFFFVVCSCF